MRSGFRDLVVYQRAAELGDELYASVARWRSFERSSLGLQLVRAVDSVAANVAEASGRGHKADRHRVLLIARGSLYEAEHWMIRGEARGLLELGSHKRLREIARTLSGLIKAHAPH